MVASVCLDDLGKIPLLVEQPDASEGHAEIACGLERSLATLPSPPE
jgi:hypothetical protein